MGSIISLFRDRVAQFAEKTALYYKDPQDKYISLSYKRLYELASQFGIGLMELGLKKGEHIGIISDNKKEWMIANIGILGIGAIDVPRGSDSTVDEIRYILNHADCALALVENETQLEKVISGKDSLPLLKTIIVMEESVNKNEQAGVTLYSFPAILEKGKTRLLADKDLFNREVDGVTEEDLATIIYTSGTTGEPKGVMLTHSNFLHQIRAPLKHINIGPTDIFLSVLPVWHAFERSVEYVALFAGCSLAYSKLIGKILLADMEAINPTIFPSVPRIWESVRSSVYKTVNAGSGIKKVMFRFFVSVGAVHSSLRNMFKGLIPQFKKRSRVLDVLVSFLPLLFIKPLNALGQLLVFKKIKSKLGTQFRFGVSGAGALPPHVDNFFSACGVLILEGYGLTEAAPICSVRMQKAPVPNTIGPPLPELEIKILDQEGNPVKTGEKGVLYVKGPNVMKGYYKKPEETGKVLSEDGWLNTGDLAVLTHQGRLAIRGRVKETIVLLGGENVEPGPIEDIILQSEYINQAVVLGQDKKYLSALVIPNFEALEEYTRKYNIPYEDHDNLIGLPEINELIKEEIAGRINTKKGFKVFERIFKFRIINATFEPGEELTHTLKIKRDVVNARYKKEIESLYKQV
ncbi:MAG: AMP-binding protein [Spirochaetales bacterium]|nr:AMP-binding protein [Spirochaetales bacterium]